MAFKLKKRCVRCLKVLRDAEPGKTADSTTKEAK